MTRLVVLVILVVVPAMHAAGAEQSVDSQIISVAMFKNGLAFVQRRIEVPGPGTYLLSWVPEPIHGTFWLESKVKVEARVSHRSVRVAPRTGERINLQEELAGKDVVLHFQDGRIPPAAGKVLGLNPAGGAEAWDRRHRQPAYHSPRRPSHGSLLHKRFLILKTEKGLVYVDSSLIAYAQVQAMDDDTVSERRPVLLLNVAGEKKDPATIVVSYLTKGITWAPSYRVDLSDPKELTIEQKAVIKNELEDIENAEMYLISGFPSVPFAHVASPISPRTNWQNFLGQLNRGRTPVRGLGTAVQQIRTVSNSPSMDGIVDTSSTPMGKGPDLHYESIGPRSLAEGESLSLTVASGRAPYERLVEWIVPDTRRADGRHISGREQIQYPKRYRDTAWDAIRFKNPLTFPMTTGASMITGNGHFFGQSMSSWFNTGEEATVHITQALSIRTRSVESEVPGKREIVRLAGDDYQKTEVQGELSLWNHRDETVKVMIRRRFSGELLQADGDHRCVLREEGVWSVNKCNELTWVLALEPGAAKDLTYRYSVMVHR